MSNKIINIREYVRSKELEDDYLNEVSYWTNCFIQNNNKLEKLKKKKFCLFKKRRIVNMQRVVDADKFCIKLFTNLYSDVKDSDLLVSEM